MATESSKFRSLNPRRRKPTKYLICSGVPLLVALVMDQAASLRVLNSSCRKMWIRTGKMLASMTAWICCRLPAVMFETVHDASFRIDSFSDDSKCRMCGSAPLFSMTWVWTSSPVTMFPTARRAAFTMLFESCLEGRKISREPLKTHSGLKLLTSGAPPGGGKRPHRWLLEFCRLVRRTSSLWPSMCRSEYRRRCGTANARAPASLGRLSRSLAAGPCLDTDSTGSTRHF